MMKSILLNEPDSAVSMSPERLLQVEELYHSARERLPGDRARLLAQADPELRHEVESLLAQDGENLLDGQVMEVAAKLLDDSSEERLEVGSQLGPYKIESSIGAGGMGKVYKARDTRLGRAVAIKISSKQFNARFEREARAISALNHPHICTLHDVRKRLDGSPGRSRRTFLRGSKPGCRRCHARHTGARPPRYRCL
jgi:serine/threonine protein kinase